MPRAHSPANCPARFRLSTPAFGLVRAEAADETDIKDGATTVRIKKGETVFTSFISAGLDEHRFPDPKKIKLDRPEDSYIHHGWGPHACLGKPIVTVAGASMLRACARLNNFRRAKGPAGEMKSKFVNHAFKVFLAEDGSEWGPFPNCKCVSNSSRCSTNPLSQPNWCSLIALSKRWTERCSGSNVDKIKGKLVSETSGCCRRRALDWRC